MFSKVSLDHFVKEDLNCRSCGNIAGSEKKVAFVETLP